MVFYSKPLLALALRASGLVPDRTSLADCLKFSFQKLRNTLFKQVSSFIEFEGAGVAKNKTISFIPEIVHSGLGLGYNLETERAVNPWTGEAITDQEVILESRIDRAMIEVSLELRQKYPRLRFSSCTRLCDIWTSAGKLVADIHTGKLKPMPDGEKGISAQLRSVHGGLYPQSDLVVADDPLAEIAARTWIDEYARLDRRQLLWLPYSDWLAQARPEVVAAVNKLNGPFLPNKWEGSADEERKILEEILGDNVPGSEEEGERISSVDGTDAEIEEDQDDESQGYGEDHEEEADSDKGDEADGNDGESDDGTLDVDALIDLNSARYMNDDLLEAKRLGLTGTVRPVRALSHGRGEDLKRVTIWSVDSSEDEQSC
ncbi:hypothetical protein H2200_011329 [Cladophialophora chaetospira]|uniref:Uncharacterized protein n=1 Tax=Cladophialophora chaetospira TaxID=386627 RepID=A0AA39CDP1_9EURO|nr:hypothetical protein H2200_011329 [Cladophialophora chaetospira]